MATQGPLYPSTAANDTSVGSLPWSNPNNAKVSDGVYTLVGGFPGTTNYLKVTNFGFSIPSGESVLGILVEIEKLGLIGTGITDYEVKLVKSDGTIGSTNKADTVSAWPATDEFVQYGSNSDLWGESWAYSDINSASFGVVLSAQPASAFPEVDSIRITITYGAGPTTNIKSVDGVAYASIKSIDQIAIASVKNIDGIA